MADLGIIFLRRKHTIHWYESLFTIITGSMRFVIFGPPCITWLFHIWILRRCFKFTVLALPLGPMEAMRTIWKTLNPLPLGPKDKFCQFFFFFMHFEEADESYFLHWAPPPPQPITPLRGPMGPPWELLWTTLIPHQRSYLHTRELECSTAGSGEDDVWYFHSFGPWKPSPWAPMGATCTILTTLNPLPLRMIPAKSDHAFSKRRWNS